MECVGISISIIRMIRIQIQIQASASGFRGSNQQSFGQLSQSVSDSVSVAVYYFIVHRVIFSSARCYRLVQPLLTPLARALG